ncbi:GWxTD domain-containing protein, partial [candidate division KSB1 bacterium]
AKYRATGNLTYIEVYSSIPRNILQFDPEENRLVSNFEIAVSIFKNDTLIFNEGYNKVDYTENLTDIKDYQKLLNTVRLYMKEGEYRLVVKLTDLNSRKMKEIEQLLEITPGQYDDFSLSDIEIASSITRATEENEFYKNGFTVIPNPERVFGDALPKLYFYNEIYNLNYNEGANNAPYELLISITSATGDTINVFPVRSRRKPGPSSVEVGEIDVSDYSRGLYRVNLAIRDTDTGETTTKIKDFLVFNERVATQNFGFVQEISRQERIELEENEIKNLNEEQLSELFDSMRYITSDKDKIDYESFRFEEKRRFIAVFWADKDPIPETIINEFKQEFLERFEYANNNFTEHRDGWMTDRGRIFIMYGAPDHLDISQNVSESVAFQVWYYYESAHVESERGGLEFVFADIRQRGGYELIHSTSPREIHNNEWRDLIIK